ncbi:NADP-dependent malic enzyme [Bdellovibrionota bacterium FG-2]
MTNIYKQSLEYHAKGRKGKIEVNASKTMATQHDLSLAYTPGVAEPCRMIAEQEDLIYEYTAKGNLVAVISNGTAVLGLGNIGPYGAKPVMEGKAVLFKKFADIDVFDIELNASDPDEVIRVCQALEPTFGGINLEDIKAPECFYIEEELKKRLKIPVFHDDQHGTAIICGAAFLNALEVVGKRIDEAKCVFVGGGAACISSAKMFLQLGVRRENLIMTDLDGVIYEGRAKGMNPYKQAFARSTSLRTLSDALVGADTVVGLSAKGALTGPMIGAMARDPIIFAMANPDPEVLPEEVLAVRKDAIMATGRSDYPNQVNNVLGFPFIFRGALDVRATAINEEMKLAAVRAIAELAKQEMPESVVRAYGGQRFHFGREYLIPKPFDQRALLWVAPAVAEAAMKSGVARINLDLETYRERLESLLGASYTFMRGVKNRLKETVFRDRPYRLAFPEGEHPTVLRAAQILIEEKIAEPILLGDEGRIRQQIRDLELDHSLSGIAIINPLNSKYAEAYAKHLTMVRARKGVTLNCARELLQSVNYFGPMMVEMGDADALLNGVSQSYPQTIRPAIQTIGVLPDSRLVGVYLVMLKKRTFWFADTTVNINPSAEELAQIAIQTARFASQFMVDPPRIAMLSFSNFGSSSHPCTKKVQDATEMVRRACPDVIIDGEMQVDTALNPEISANSFPFNRVPGDANILIFPDLQSANIAYKLVGQLAQSELIGPILLGMKKPIYVLAQNSSVTEVVNIATLAAMGGQTRVRHFEQSYDSSSAV